MPTPETPEVFISYARTTEAQAHQIGAVLRAQGYSVWWDEVLPAHRAYGDVIAERLKEAKAVVVIWSADAARSQWVRAEADAARQAGKLVQLSIDGATLPMPFNQIQCPVLTAWSGDRDSPGWRKVENSVAELVGFKVEKTDPPEVSREDMGRLIADDARQKLVEALKGLGFTYVSLDLEGYRTGSMNEQLGRKTTGRER